MDEFDVIWTLMEQYEFEIAETSSNCVICSICGRLMKNPCSSICGCQFCLNCIRNYLNNDKKLCPGTNTKCKKVILEMDKNVSKDFRTCFDIARTTVKCPNRNCAFTKELENIVEHIRLCKMKPMSCPYQSLGCVDSQETGETINDHLLLENLSHAQLLIEAVNNIRNDISNMRPDEGRREFEELQGQLSRIDNVTADQELEINNLKEELRRMEAVAEGLKKDLRDEEERSKADVFALKKERDQSSMGIIELREVIRDLRNELKKSQDLEKIKTEELKKDVVDMKDVLDFVVRELENVKQDKGKNAEIEAMKKTLEEQRLEVNTMRNKMVKCSEEINKMNVSRDEVILRVMYDFLWTIADFPKKKGELFSDHFSTNNYKLCLRAWIGSDRLWLFVCVKKGDRDSRAQWPLKHEIILSVLNQETLTPHISERYGHTTYKDDPRVFNQPINDSDGRIGGLEILLSDISGIRGILYSGSLKVACSLHPPPQ